MNRLKRVWYVMSAVFTFGLIKAEEKTVLIRRQELINRKISGLNKAKDKLGDLAGTVRMAAREVSTLKVKVETNPDLKGLLESAETNLKFIATEYEACRTLILKTEDEIRVAREKGEHLAQQYAFVKVRRDVTKISDSIKNIGGLTDELSQIDAMIIREIDKMEGHIRGVEGVQTND